MPEVQTDKKISIHRTSLRDLDVQIRSNRSIIWICTYEEKRVIESIKALCERDEIKNKWNLLTWDVASGLSSKTAMTAPKDNIVDPVAVLDWFASLESDQSEKGSYTLLLLKDFQRYVDNDVVLRQLRNMAQDFIGKPKAIILMSTALQLPPELDKDCTVIDWPLPETEHILDKVNSLLQVAKNMEQVKKRFQCDYTDEEMDDIVRAYQGLTLGEIELLTSSTILTEKRLDPAHIGEKKRDAIRKSGLLDWIEVDANMGAVGGLNGIKAWLETRKGAFTTEAKEYGLPPYPKGLLMVGVQGGGKSLCAKAISSYWNLPLLRLDMGKIFSGVVGSSEENIRAVIKVAESVAPCVLMIDEIEKGLSGTASSNQTDGGTASRVFGSLLTWMQDKKSPVYVVGTANDVSQLPPELLRKGRFDEIFFIDLPRYEDRFDIFGIHLAKRGWNEADYNIEDLVQVSEGFTGAEIEAAIESAMYMSFHDGKRKLITQDIVRAIEETVPLSVTMSEKITALRAWSKQRARNASGNEPPKRDNIIQLNGNLDDSNIEIDHESNLSTNWEDNII